MGVKSNIGDSKKFMQKLVDAVSSFEREFRQRVPETVAKAKENVIEMDAYDTGRLHNNIKGEYRATTAKFESRAIDPEDGQNYAPEVHYGTGPGRNSVPRPYLQNAFREFIIKMEQDILNKIEKIK